MTKESITEELTTKRELVIAKADRIFKYVLEEYKESDKITELTTRKSSLESCLKKFEDIQEQLAVLNPKELTSIQNISDGFEKKYYKCISQINNYTSNHESKGRSEASMKENDSTTININLPSFKLPTFSGAYSEWLSFYDTFNNLVHKDERLSDCQKFHYLKSCLTGEALRAVESLSVSNANYNAAYTILENRFKNERLIVQDHVYALLKFPPIDKSSDTNLRQLVDTITINLEALRSLKVPVETWDDILVPLIHYKLDFITKKEWESSVTKERPKFKDLKSFLEKRCEFLESVSVSNKMHHNNMVNNNKSSLIQKNKSAAHTATNKIECNLCKENHNIFQCLEFKAMSEYDRKIYAKNKKLCFNCLRSNHQLSACKSTKCCKECKGRHHSLLHVSQQTQNSEQIASTSTNFVCNEKSVLLSTAIVIIKDKFNRTHECRALLDMGSQSHFISENMCKKLGIRKEKSNLTIMGVNSSSSLVTQYADIMFYSKYKDYSANIKCYVVPKVTADLPLQSIDISHINIPTNIELADPEFYKSRPVDLLIGAGTFWSLLINNQIRENKNHPHFQETKLGWIVGGSVDTPNPNLSSCHLNTAFLETQMSRFWEVEELSHKLEGTDENKDCEEQFVSTHKRLNNGRFVVNLPFKSNPVNLGSSRETAEKRLTQLERKLSKQPQVKEAYTKFLREYKDLDHMELVEDSKIPENCYYLPHHAVLKDSSISTKLRIVFDASAKTNNGQSLNDNLMVGPNLQRDLFSILLRFRTYRYVISGDIEKMYRQILIEASHSNYQLIVWRENTEDPIQTYRLKTVTYGVNSAPFLAMRTVQQLAFENQTVYPLACKNILENFYMDDLLCGHDTIEGAVILQKQIIEILSQGQFHLYKWASNASDLIPRNDDNVLGINAVNFNKGENTKTLGLVWNCANDELKYKININPQPRKVTKRTILSIISQIFDPLGLISPFVIKAKILMQGLWSLKLDWDKIVPIEIHQIWSRLINEIHELQNLSIPRYVTTTHSNTIEIHGFSDASTKAYGAAIYLKTCASTNTVHLLCSKSKVAPLKTITLPRLELLGALLLARLLHKILESFKTYINITSCTLWTDSSIVLNWLNATPNTWQTFVANRVSEIQTLTSKFEWRHIRSQDNPADHITRGLTPAQLSCSNLWFSGPSWLIKDQSEWPTSIIHCNSEIPEKRKSAIVATPATTTDCLNFKRFSAFFKLQRVIAYCLRFIHNLKNPGNKHAGSLSLSELNASHDTIIKYVQRESFSEEIQNLKKNKPISSHSKLIYLSPIFEDGLLRVGGRIKHANLSYDVKHPILLPDKHHVTNLLIRAVHIRQLHAGPQSTLYNLRLKYWPINARNNIRKIVQTCIDCFRTNPQPVNTKMGDLPSERLEPLRPFLRTGIDYAGPILIKQGNQRSKKSVKSYIALFICMATKAIHLELVTDLTTEAFLAALNRFISRRGNVLHIYSDNGTNFIGARRHLNELGKFLKSKQFSDVDDSLSQNNIDWHFLPPRSPHMGGLWEAGIKTVKMHLKKICGTALLTFEELYTLLTRIEACINSRPLTPLTSDPNDLTVLSPAHFLIGEPLTAPLERDLTQVNIGRLSRFERLEKLRQHFWERWTKEYLSQLQHRPRNRNSTKSVEVGNLVLLMEDNIPPLKWKIGRVVKIHPGADGIVRVVTVKTAYSETQRAVRKLCVLPLESN